MQPTRATYDRSLARGLAWTGGIRWTGQVVSWAITIVVARLLTPAEYGLAGMAAVYTGFTLLLCEAGLTAALLRRDDSLPVAQAQLGGFAAVLGVGGSLLSLMIAKPLAVALGQAGVRELVMVAGIGFIPRGLQVLPRAILARELDFRRLAWIEGLEGLGGSLMTLVLALAGAGVWSLILGSLFAAIVGMILSYHWSPQQLAWPSHFGLIANDVIFGSKVLGSQLAWYAYTNADFAMVGLLLGPKALGAYTIAWTLANIPVDRVSSLVSRVAPAYFATLSRDILALRRQVVHLTEALALVTFPTCIGLALVGDDLVGVVLGPTWTAAIRPLEVLAVMAAIRSIFVVAPPILVFTGQVERNLRFSIASALLLPFAFGFAAQWGIVAVAMTWLLVYPGFASVFLLRHALRAVSLPRRLYFTALRDPIIATSVMITAVLLFRATAPIAPGTMLRLGLEAGIGAAAYLVVAWLLAGARIRHVVTLLRGDEPSDEPAAPAPVPGERRLAVVTYHFPPDPAVGGLRWRKLARFATERGWSLDVIAHDPAELVRSDPSGLTDLPRSVRVHHVATPRSPWAAIPARLWRLIRPAPSVRPGLLPVPASRPATSLTWWPRTLRDVARMYFAWVDHHHGARWGDAAAMRLQQLHAESPFDAIISCGPPHPPHPRIHEVAEAAGIPFILDLRDPWSLLQRLPEAVASPVWLEFARREERRCIASAALIVVTTEAHRDALRGRYPAEAERIIAVRNGCDDDPVPASTGDGRFVVRYAGSIYLDRDPRPLFRAAARFVMMEQLAAEHFAIEFMGEVSTHDGISLQDWARIEGVAEYVHCLAPRPRPEALAFLAGATMLTLLPQDSDMAIPAKVFEYLRYPAWLLVLAEPESATAQLLRGSGADVVSADDSDEILRTLQRRYREHRAGVTPPRLADDQRFGRAAQASLLFDALEEVLAPTAITGTA